METFGIISILYFVVGGFTYGIMSLDAEYDKNGYLTKESSYKLFWGSVFWPVTLAIVIFEVLKVFFYYLYHLPGFIADAVLWGIGKISKKEKNPEKTKSCKIHDKNFSSELCQMMYDWEDSEEPAQDIAEKHEGEILQAAFKILSEKIKMDDKYPDGITEVDIDELIWGNDKNEKH